MSKFLVLFVIVLAAQNCLSKPKKAQAESSEGKILEDLANQAKVIADNVTHTLQAALPDSSKVTEVLKTQSQEFANNVKNIVDQLQEKIKDNQGTIDSAIQQVSTKLAETVQNLQKAAGADATAKAKELKQKLDEGVKNAATELDNLVKAVQPNLQAAGENIQSLTKNVLDEFIENTRKLQTQVNQAISKQ